jgi:hypothetical protein
LGCIITDKALVIDAGGTASAVVGATITARPTYLPVYRLVSGEMREIASPTLTDTSDAAGEWSFTLPWPSESDPSTVQWAIITQDGFTLVGTVPEGVAGPITLHDLKDDYDWALSSNTSDIPIAIEGPAGMALEVTAVKTGAYQAVVNDLVRCNPTSAAFTVTLPASPVADSIVGVQHVTDSANLVTVDGGAATINGLETVTIGPRDGAIFQYDGTNWMVIS